MRSGDSHSGNKASPSENIKQIGSLPHLIAQESRGQERPQSRRSRARRRAGRGGSIRVLPGPGGAGGASPGGTARRRFAGNIFQLQAVPEGCGSFLERGEFTRSHPWHRTPVAARQIRWVCVAWLRCGARAAVAAGGREDQGNSDVEKVIPCGCWMNLVWDSLDLHRGGLKGCPGRLSPHGMAGSLPMSSDFQHYSFRMPNIGFQNLPLNIYIVVFGTAIFVFILSLLFCCYLIR
ncbi:uncharacterized protein LOC113979056 [Neopelma chrysocephalum]|uniref:uncharacterized protein LOC113979056 n=1 Tax=Neopelma chrysocephalum TaxID=114329 RepID=UPI000FCD10AD|nr:uncharacterized protein LOC113979056 [Neopelma chrysocephalum]